MGERRLDTVGGPTCERGRADAVGAQPGPRRIGRGGIGWKRDREHRIAARLRGVPRRDLRHRASVQNGPDQEGEADPTHEPNDDAE